MRRKVAFMHLHHWWASPWLSFQWHARARGAMAQRLHAAFDQLHRAQHKGCHDASQCSCASQLPDLQLMPPVNVWGRWHEPRVQAHLPDELLAQTVRHEHSWGLDGVSDDRRYSPLVQGTQPALVESGPQTLTACVVRAWKGLHAYFDGVQPVGGVCGAGSTCKAIGPKWLIYSSYSIRHNIHEIWECSPTAPAKNCAAAVWTALECAPTVTYAPAPWSTRCTARRLASSSRMCWAAWESTSMRVHVQCGWAAPGRYILTAGCGWSRGDQAQTADGDVQAAGERTTAVDGWKGGFMAVIASDPRLATRLRFHVLIYIHRPKVWIGSTQSGEVRAPPPGAGTKSRCGLLVNLSSPKTLNSKSREMQLIRSNSESLKLK